MIWKQKEYFIFILFWEKADQFKFNNFFSSCALILFRQFLDDAMYQPHFFHVVFQYVILRQYCPSSSGPTVKGHLTIWVGIYFLALRFSPGLFVFFVCPIPDTLIIVTLYSGLKSETAGPGKKPVLAEDLHLTPSTHMVVHKHLYSYLKFQGIRYHLTIFWISTGTKHGCETYAFIQTKHSYIK